MIAEYDASGTLQREYVWLDDRPVAARGRHDAGHLVHAHGSSRSAGHNDRRAGWPTWRGRPNTCPYGEVASITGPASLDYRFPGQWFQLESGLHYNWPRHYDATTGRYVQPDPLGMPDGPSRWSYAGNSPLMNVDPEGRFFVPLGAWGEVKTGLQALWDLLFPPYCVYNPIDPSVGLPFGTPPSLQNEQADQEKSPPNPNGRKGSQEHQDKVKERADELEAAGHEITAGGKRLPEKAVTTPEGKVRYPDISTVDPKGDPYHENVGRSKGSGDPIAREQRALDDISRATGTQPGFTPYNR